MESYITNNKREIREYQELRSDIYKKELNWRVCPDKLKTFDKWGYIIVLKHLDKIVGGCRVMLSKDMNVMSNENMEFTYLNILKKNHLPYNQYSEINDIIIDKKFRGNLHTLVSEAIQMCVKEGAFYLFSVQGMSRCRLYKMCLSEMGYKSTLKKDNLWNSLPEYNYSTDYAMITDIKNNTNSNK